MPSPVLIRRAFPIAAASSLLIGAAFIPAAPAHATAEHTVTFEYSGEQESWTVPVDISSLTVEVTGAQGSWRSSDGARGGSVRVDLGTDYAGQELSVLVGGEGQGSPVTDSRINYRGGGGSFLALGEEFLVVSGGGGGSGEWMHYDRNHYPAERDVLSGGNGGAGDFPAEDARSMYIPLAAGHGADGLLPGEPGIGYGASQYQGEAGTVASISTNGVISPGLGGIGGHVSGAGGGGLAGGGGGGSMDAYDFDFDPEDWTFEQHQDFGAGGGGSGFLAPGLTALSTGTNTGDGSIIFTYTTAELDQAPAFSAVPSDQAVLAGEAIEPVTVTATGSPTPTLSLTGELPAGVTFDPDTGHLSGTPTLAGEFMYTITATNGIEPDAAVTHTIEVTAAAVASLSITPSAHEIYEGSSITFTVDGADEYGNTVHVTDATLSSDVATDEINGLTVTFPHASEHTITATTVSGVTASATVQVIPATGPAEPLDPDTVAATPPTAKGSGGKLAATGAEMISLLPGIAAILLAGGGALLWSRRHIARRQAEDCD